MAMANLGTARHRFGSDGSLSSQIIEQTEALDGYISRFAVQKNGNGEYACADFTGGGFAKLGGGRYFATHRTARARVYDFDWAFDRSQSAEQFAAMSQLVTVFGLGARHDNA